MIVVNGIELRVGFGDEKILMGIFQIRKLDLDRRQSFAQVCQNRLLSIVCQSIGRLVHMSDMFDFSENTVAFQCPPSAVVIDRICVSQSVQQVALFGFQSLIAFI